MSLFFDETSTKMAGRFGGSIGGDDEQNVSRRQNLLSKKEKLKLSLFSDQIISDLFHTVENGCSSNV